jgi:hypothetical protein
MYNIEYSSNQIEHGLCLLLRLALLRSNQHHLFGLTNGAAEDSLILAVL